MKASAFSYARATSVGDALELLVAHGDKAKVLSGGQSLMPAMNLRLISPELIVDIGELAELRGIAVRGDVLNIGALTRHVDLLNSPDIAAHAPLLTEAIAHVAHPAIRNRGTLGGSLAHADPASELPACMVALNAIIIIRGQASERRIAAEDFFTGIYETALSAQELLVAVELPVTKKESAHFFFEFARRHGDYAIAGLAAQAIMAGGRLAGLRMAHSLPSATGLYWPGPRTSSSTSLLRLRRWRMRRQRWAKSLIPRTISRRPLRCAGILRSC